MILFTGGGAIAEKYSQAFSCNIISARNLDDDELTSWILKSTVIIHNAAIIQADSIDEYIEGNFILTKRILDLVYKVNPKVKFINISSMSMLANTNDYLSPELMSEYAYSKYISEQYCIEHPYKDLTNVRLSTIFYEDYSRDGISKMIHDCFTKNEIVIYNNGNAQRDIIPIRIVCEYLNKLSNSVTMNRKMNIVSGESKSFKNVCEILQTLNKALKVHNEQLKTSFVLSEFSKKDIKNLGEIEFDLEEEINNYLSTLHEDTNL